MSFLTAEWRRLILVNYAIDPALLLPYLPKHTELDAWNDMHYVSLVGFMFKNTRLLGIKVPFHVNFEEVNLRFYVKHHDGQNWKRGVVFIKEIVPKPALTLVANTIYKEHYQTLPMQHNWQQIDSKLSTTYSWQHKGIPQSVSTISSLKSQPIAEGTEAAFITEHYWGYTRVSPNTTFEYEVTHPTWEQYPVESHEIHVDFGALYGQSFGSLTTATPVSVFLAEGSPITVENKRRL